jgi:hypothetical protein
MTRFAVTKCLAVAASLVGIYTAMAGPAPLAVSSKDKEVQMEQAPVCDPHWYFTIGGGAEFDIGDSSLVNGFSLPFTAEIPSFPGVTAARYEINSRNWNDFYDTTWRIQGEAGYALTSHLEIFGLFKYAHADASSGFAGIGDILIFNPFIGNLTSTTPLSARFDDYSSYGGQLGFRFFFLPKQSRFRPYLSLSGGATHVDSINATIVADTTSIGGPNDFLFYRGGFFSDSWTASGAAMLGLEVSLACRWALGVEGGVRYESRLGQNDSDLKGLRFFDDEFATPLRSFRPVNDNAGDRWTVPVTGYVKFRF